MNPSPQASDLHGRTATTVPDGFDVLTDLLAGGDDHESLRAAWGRGPGRLRAGKRALDVVSATTIEEWINASGLLPPQVGLLVDGVPVPPGQITLQRSFYGRGPATYLDAAKISRGLARGATLEFHPIEEFHPPAARLCHELEAALRAQVNTFVFLSPRAEYGRKVHVDAAHVLAVQLEGTKTWEVYRELGDADAVPPARTVTLSPGDLYYLPPGTPHRAFAGDSGSLHVTFAISEPTLRVLTEVWARRYASSFGRHMWIGGDHQQRLELTRMRQLEMSEALRTADPDQLLAAAEEAWAEPRGEWVRVARAMDAHRAEQE